MRGQQTRCAPCRLTARKVALSVPFVRQSVGTRKNVKLLRKYRCSAINDHAHLLLRTSFEPLNVCINLSVNCSYSWNAFFEKCNVSVTYKRRLYRCMHYGWSDRFQESLRSFRFRWNSCESQNKFSVRLRLNRKHAFFAVWKIHKQLRLTIKCCNILFRQ